MAIILSATLIASKLTRTRYRKREIAKWFDEECVYEVAERERLRKEKNIEEKTLAYQAQGEKL